MEYSEGMRTPLTIKTETFDMPILDHGSLVVIGGAIYVVKLTNGTCTLHHVREVSDK